MLSQKAWSPYLAGVVIGLLQIPAFLIVETALGASSSYVTVGAWLTAWLDPSILDIKYASSHVAATWADAYLMSRIDGSSQAVSQAPTVT